MTYKEYEEKAITTRVYDPKVAIPYVALGLCGEIGELHEKINATTKVEEVRKELGDVLWYLAALRVELNLTVDENWPTVEEGELESVDCFVFPVESGKIAEQVKKYLRDDWKDGEENIFPEKRKEVIQEAWKKLMKAAVAFACDDFFDKVGIEVIAAENNEKLATRKKNNCIHGDGDASIR